jgi:hypothetical protein
MTLVTTPKQIDARVRGFCSSIVRPAAPQYVDITPGAGCIPLECFENVRTYVQAHGGRIQFGWTIWEWTGVFLEAEHHAVFDPGNGRGLVDLTPAQDRETQRLFLPDDSATYDFANLGVRTENKRLALRNDPLIEAFFDAARQKAAFMNTLPGFGMVSLNFVQAQQRRVLEENIARLQALLFKKYAGPNTPCICGSGKKYKRCHGAAA